MNDLLNLAIEAHGGFDRLAGTQKHHNSGDPPRGIATDAYRGLQGYLGRRLSHCK